jgi:predicted permease
MGISIFVPSMMFAAIVTTDITLLDLGKIMLYGVLATAAVAVCTIIPLKYIFRWEEKKINSLLLISCFPNVGNFGLPVALFAFGDTGLAIMMIYSMAQAILCKHLRNLSGLQKQLHHARLPEKRNKNAGDGRHGPRHCHKGPGHPHPRHRRPPFSLMSGAVVPVLLICVGVQLSRISFANIKSYFASSMISRFIYYPLIAVPIILPFFDLSSLMGKTLLLAAFMPSASAIVSFVIKFDPDNVAVPTGTLITNTLCVVGLSVVLKFLM